jgi:hypothetical protein
VLCGDRYRITPKYDQPVQAFQEFFESIVSMWQKEQVQQPMTCLQARKLAGNRLHVHIIRSRETKDFGGKFINSLQKREGTNQGKRLSAQACVPPDTTGKNSTPSFFQLRKKNSLVPKHFSFHPQGVS